MADKKSQASTGSEPVPASKLRDLDVLDAKVKNVKGGAAKKRRRKRDIP
ncbi:MAG: hypothetical protein IT457_09880 [Planctomycetes bacterium]|nr:hypothetical protein [Planctomycetota bacterium]